MAAKKMSKDEAIKISTIDNKAYERGTLSDDADGQKRLLIAGKVKLKRPTD